MCESVSKREEIGEKKTRCFDTKEKPDFVHTTTPSNTSTINIAVELEKKKKRSRILMSLCVKLPCKMQVFTKIRRVMTATRGSLERDKTSIHTWVV